MTVLLRPLVKEPFLSLRNRVAMSAMSRSAAPDHLATPAMRDYYALRAEGGAGLIITEGTIIHRSGDGWNDAPHIETDYQAESWRPVVEAVHAGGAAILSQLWHMGRISHADYTGSPPVSSTDRPASGINRQNGKPYGKPIALLPERIPDVLALYAAAARRALAVGFDGVELHCGHGYLPDQFLDARVNDRRDGYGGSVENRCRFTIELVEAVLKVVPSDRLAIRISPSRDMGGPYEWPDLDAMLDHLVGQLGDLRVGALDISCANSDYFRTAGRIVRRVRPHWNGVLLGGASLTAEQAAAEISEGWLDVVTWGRAFIANADLAKKIAMGRSWIPFEDSMRATLV